MGTSWGTRRRALSIAAAIALPIAAALVLTPGPAGADPAPAASGEALELEAEKVEVDLEKKTALLEGKVRLRRGDLVVACPRVEARFGEVSNVTWARASGGVSAEARGLRATAPEAELDVARGTLTLLGEVRIQKDGIELRAAGAVLDLATMRLALREVKGRIPARGRPNP